MESTTEPGGFGQEVVLRMPANAESLPVARTWAAAVVSQWGFTLDVVEDARLVVSELLTFVHQSRPGCLTQLSFMNDDSTLRLAIHTDESLAPPTPESFGWLVVSELSSDLDVRSDNTGLTITAAMSSSGTPG